MATSEGIPSSIDIEFLELNDNPYCMLVFILQSQSVSSFNKFNSVLINLHRR